HPHRSFTLSSSLARRRDVGRQAATQDRGRMIQAGPELFQRNFAGGVALLGREAAGFVVKIMSQDLSHPCQEFALMSARELGKVAVGFEKRLLNDVARVALGAQTPAELTLRQQPEVMAIALEELFARFRLAMPAALD